MLTVCEEHGREAKPEGVRFEMSDICSENQTKYSFKSKQLPSEFGLILSPNGVGEEILTRKLS